MLTRKNYNGIYVTHCHIHMPQTLITAEVLGSQKVIYEPQKVIYLSYSNLMSTQRTQLMWNVD